MTPKQREYYDFLANNLEQGIFPDVGNRTIYLSIYARNFLQRWREVGLPQMAGRLVDLAEAYHKEEEFAAMCIWSAGDCLLALGLFKEFLELTEPSEPFGTATHSSNLRLNVQYQLGRDGSAVDLYRMAEGDVTTFTEKHPGLFREILDDTFEQEAEQKGRWFDRIIAKLDNPEPIYRHDGFGGIESNDRPRLNLQMYCFYAANKFDRINKRFVYNFNDEIRACARRAENRLRDRFDIPRVGEGWVSETELYHAVSAAFPETAVIHHGRPNWLGRQHFDIWLPRWKIAVEYHGEQHFRPVEFFGGQKGFEETQARDKRKAHLSRDNNVELIVVTEEMANDQVIALIKLTREKRSAKPEADRGNRV